MKNKISITTLLFLLTGLLYGCSSELDPINYGSDVCAHCNMKIMDNRFGAELLNTKSKAYKFDAAECMVDYIKKNTLDIKEMYVTDFINPGQFITAGTSYFLISPKRRSPMGEDLSAYKTKSDAETAKNSVGGDVYSWEELKTQLGK
ncbi:MAG: nitrous oxide reductase accessory protein NosL [Candidatus Kapaibacterium sp.]